MLLDPVVLHLLVEDNRFMFSLLEVFTCSFLCLLRNFDQLFRLLELFPSIFNKGVNLCKFLMIYLGLLN